MWCPLLLLQLLIQFLCLGLAKGQIQPRIVGGSTTTLSAVGGFMVNLRYDGTFYCGGSLVSSRGI